MAASTPSHQCAKVSLANRSDKPCRYASMLRMASAWTIARLSGKNWYTEPIATSARSASSVVVRPSYPTSSTSSAQASSMRWTRATLLPCTGTRRNGPVVTVGVDTRRHSLSAVIIGTLLGSTSEEHRRDAGDTGHSGFCATVRSSGGHSRNDYLRERAPLAQLGRQPAGRGRRHPDSWQRRRGFRHRQDGVGIWTKSEGGRQRSLLHLHRGGR